VQKACEVVPAPTFGRHPPSSYGRRLRLRSSSTRCARGASNRRATAAEGCSRRTDGEGFLYSATTPNRALAVCHRLLLATEHRPPRRDHQRRQTTKGIRTNSAGLQSGREVARSIVGVEKQRRTAVERRRSKKEQSVDWSERVNAWFFFV